MRILYLLLFAIFTLLVGVPNLEAEELGSNLAFIGSYDTADEVRGVTILGNHAYIADFDGGVVILNIEAPTNPILIGSYDTEGYAYKINISGNHAYIADYENGVVILNIEDPTNPILVGNYDTNAARDIAISGNYAYVAD